MAISYTQPAKGVLGNIVISLSRNNEFLLIPAFRKDKFTWSPAEGQLLYLSDVRDVVSRVLQTSPIQLIFGPRVDKYAINMWVQEGRLKPYSLYIEPNCSC